LRPADFIATARDLVDSNPRGRPRETNLRRAVSTTYYALFHCLAAAGADLLVGGAGADRSRPAWRQAYRALQHGPARKRCERSHIIARFPIEIQDFASAFSVMQQKRHDADYDPDAAFVKSEVLASISEAEAAIQRFGEAPLRDRRAFAVYVLLDLRSS
jgi:uncharacterized protein (UPF0332 family)